MLKRSSLGRVLLKLRLFNSTKWKLSEPGACCPSLFYSGSRLRAFTASNDLLREWNEGMNKCCHVARTRTGLLYNFFCTDAFFIRQERLWGRSRHIKSVLESSSEGNLPTKGPGHIHSQFAWHSLCESVTFDSRRQCLPLFWLIRLKWSCSTHTFVYIADQVSY